MYLCLFFPVFVGRDGGQYSHSFINLWNLGGGDITAGFHVVDSLFRIPVSRVLNSGFLWLHSGYQSPRFWIPQAKISRIPEPDSLTVELDFALTICKRPDFHGAVL